VVAYRPCATPNRQHAPPLAHPSCNPPVQASDHLTVGTPDANSQVPWSTGSVRLATKTGDPSTQADEADVTMRIKITDVRLKQGLGDYAGELQARLTVRLTDRYHGSTLTESGTTEDSPFSVTTPCATTLADSSVGSTCELNTTADAVVPGAIKEGKRTIWELRNVEVYDGGTDGDADTTPNTLFMRQGVFIP
jgi:hypothetical protein